MAKAIRKVGLKFIVGLLRLFERPAVCGWRPSKRPLDLTTR